jgi:hypothetical protein
MLLEISEGKNPRFQRVAEGIALFTFEEDVIVTPAPTGRINSAQGNALGIAHQNHQAPKGRLNATQNFGVMSGI